MPLLDHFHPPLYPRPVWESFHSRWANSIADELHRVLPRRYFGEVHIRLGGQFAADVADPQRTNGITRKPGTRENSSTLSVKIDKSWLRAVAAIIKS